MKLSRSGWNNVIIFSVMAMILLINVTNKQLFESDNNSDTLGEQIILGSDAVILTLAINDQLLIERIGRTWRATPENISGQLLEQMMFSWQQASGTTQLEPPQQDRQDAITVTINLAGQAQAQVLSLYPSQDMLLIYHHRQQQWFSLPIPLYRQLIPMTL